MEVKLGVQSHLIYKHDLPLFYADIILNQYIFLLLLKPALFTTQGVLLSSLQECVIFLL